MIAQESQAWKLNNPDWKETDYHAHLSELYYKGQIDTESFESHMSDYEILPSRHTRLSLRDELKRILGAENYTNLGTAGGDVDAFLRDNPNPTDEDVAAFFSKFTESAKESGVLIDPEGEETILPDGSTSTTTITFDYQHKTEEDDFLGSIAKSGDKHETDTAIQAGVAAGFLSDDDAIAEWASNNGNNVTADTVYSSIDNAVSGGNVNPNGTIATETFINTIAEDMGMPSMGGQLPPSPDPTAKLPLSGSASTGAGVPTPGGSTEAVQTTPGFNQAMQSPESIETVAPVIIPDDETQIISTGVAPAPRATYVPEESYMAPTAFSMDAGDDDYMDQSPANISVAGGDDYLDPPPQLYGMDRAQAPESFFAVEAAQQAADVQRVADDAWKYGYGEADGGITTGDRVTLVGESGPEIALFPDGTEIIPLDRDMKPDQKRRLRRRGVRGMQEGGLVFGPDEIEGRGGQGNVGAVPGASTLNDPRYITNETLEGIRS